MKIFLSLLILLSTAPASAGLLLDVGGVYWTDGLTGSTSTARSDSRTYYSLGALFTLTKNIWAGWNYSGISQVESESGTNSTFTSMDTGPYMKWQIGRSKAYSVSGVFNVLSRANITKGTEPAEKWDGTSFLVQFAIAPEISEGLYIGGAINYFSATYTKKTVSGSESSSSNAKSSIFPTLMFTKQW